MKTFLVPIDFSPVTDAVIDSAVTFARALDGKIVLLHVVQPPIVTTTEFALPVDVVREATEGGERAAKQKMIALAQLVHRADIEHQTVVKVGPPGPVILEVAQEIRADYIVLGSHGHGKLYHFLVGSTANGVIHRAKCGVIIIPPAEKHKSV